MNTLTHTCCGRCIILFFCLLGIFSFWAFLSIDYTKPSGESEIHLENPFKLGTDHLPLISYDRKCIYVVSEEGLPIANNFVLNNPGIPIEKIVYKKPGKNNSVHIFPIQRDALRATNFNFTVADIPGLFAFVFVIAFTLLGIYLLMCRNLCPCHKLDDSSEEDSCCTFLEFDPSIDLIDLDEIFESEESTPRNSPIKKISSYFNSADADELKKPLLSV